MSFHRLGTVDIHKITEIPHLPWGAEALMPGITQAILAEGRRQLPPGFIHPEDDVVYMSFHSYVLRTRHHNILVDTCVGNCKNRESLPAWHRLETPYLAELAKCGLQPADIDIVLCTHLHADHVGWNTRLLDGRWVPTFPNARYIMGRTEFDHWHRLHAENPPTPVTRGAFADSVLPIVEAGQAVLVESDHVVAHELDDTVWLEGSAGHSPGHVSVHLRSGQDHAVMSGDVIHHPLQITHPDLPNGADFDREAAIQARRRLLDQMADTSSLLLTAHFPTPTAGHVVSAGDSFGFRFK
jgi:glyoxylase-like metal-dependent hydrolase (beta-lactamase superfamily II)